MVLEAFSVSHGKTSAYLPVIDLLKDYFEIILYGHVARKGKWQSPDTGDAVPNLFGLLGVAEGKDTLGRVDAQTKKRRILEAIKRILLRESQNQPLMLIFEDLQWIDEETQALLDLLADSVVTSKLLLLVSYRPEYSHQWGGKPYYTELRLDPLGIESADEMLSALVGIGDDLTPLKRLIIKQAKGNPFFIEESVQMLLDERTLVRNGSIKLTKPVSELSVPRTVEAILASRIKRLPLEEKELLQTIAAIGREFAFSVVKGVVAKSDEELEPMLADLQSREFIHEQFATNDVEYVFKHALTQEAAYNSLSFERRKLLHERIGSVLEASFARTLDDHLDELAHHYGRSSNAGKAVEYLDRAGKQAVTRGAIKEAGIHFKNAIAALGSTSGASERMQREFDLQLALVEVLLSMSGPVTDEDSTEIRRLQELTEKTGNPGHLMSALMAAWPWAEFSALKAAWKPKQEFKFREEVVPNSSPARMPPALSWEFYLGKLESLSSRPDARRDLAAFSAVTVLLLVSLIILYARISA
jgi:predicted ATPase